MQFRHKYAYNGDVLCLPCAGEFKWKFDRMNNSPSYQELLLDMKDGLEEFLQSLDAHGDSIIAIHIESAIQAIKKEIS